MEMDPEMAAAMANNHIFKGIAGGDDSSDEDVGSDIESDDSESEDGESSDADSVDNHSVRDNYSSESDSDWEIVE